MILLIWVLNPEEIRYYALNNLTDDEIETLRSINNRYINGNELTEDQNTAFTKLQYAINDDIDEVCEFPEWKNKWISYEIDTGEPISLTSHYLEIIECGIFL